MTFPYKLMHYANSGSVKVKVPFWTGIFLNTFDILGVVNYRNQSKYHNPVFVNKIDREGFFSISGMILCINSVILSIKGMIWFISGDFIPRM